MERGYTHSEPLSMPERTNTAEAIGRTVMSALREVPEFQKEICQIAQHLKKTSKEVLDGNFSAVFQRNGYRYEYGESSAMEAYSLSLRQVEIDSNGIELSSKYARVSVDSKGINQRNAIQYVAYGGGDYQNESNTTGAAVAICDLVNELLPNPHR